MNGTVHTSSIKKEMLDSPEVMGAFRMANETHMGLEEAMELAMIALFVQNKRLREGLIEISKEINRVRTVHGDFE